MELILKAAWFLVAIAILVPLHEWGHYRMARAFGVKVFRFSVGFGRVLWGRVDKAGTEWVISALPLGGYVRMLGMGDEPVAAHEREQAFRHRPVRERALIVVAGPAANWALAILLFTVLAWMGNLVPQAVLGTPVAGSLAERAGVRSGDRVKAVSRDGVAWRDVEGWPEVQAAVNQAQALGENIHLSVTDATGHAARSLQLETEQLSGRAPDAKLLADIGLSLRLEPRIAKVEAGGAGDRSGLRAGDRVLSVDGRLITDGGQLRELIRSAHDGQTPRALQFRLERAGQVGELTVTPRVVEQSGRTLGRLDIGFDPPEQVQVSYGFVDGIAQGAQQSWDMAVMTLRMIGRMLVGEASVKNLSGPLSIADYAGQSAQAGFTAYLDFLAKISLSLAVLNLLPLPMLDGGHLMYHLFEGLSGRPVSDWWQQQLQRVGLLILMLMMALAFSNDVARYAGWH